MSTHEIRIYQARLYCEQARIVLSQVRAGIAHHLLDMAIMELRSEEARAKAGDGLMEPKPRRRSREKTSARDDDRQDGALDDSLTAR